MFFPKWIHSPFFKIFTGNYEGPSSLMEAEASKRMITHLMKKGKIIELIKDGDVKISKIVQEFH